MKVLLVDTNFSSIPIYEYLVSIECEVYLIGRDQNDFMAKKLPNYINLDYSNASQFKKIINEYNFDYIIPGCNDLSYEVCSFLGKEAFTLNIDEIEVTQTLFNKKKFRDFALRNRLSVPRLFSVEEIKSKRYYGEMIVKPVDAFSGRGITKLYGSDVERLDSAVHSAIKASGNGEFLIEEFVEGQLYSHSAFIVNERIVKDFVVEEYGSANPFVVDTSFLADKLPFNFHQRIRKDIERMANLLHLSNGLIHTQIIVNAKQYWFIEITRRCPGDLYSQLIELSTGFNYAAMYASFFIGSGLKEDLTEEKNEPIIRHTVTQNDIGVFNYVCFKEKFELVRNVPISTNGVELQPAPSGRISILFINGENEATQRMIVDKFICRDMYDVEFVKPDKKA